MLNSKTKNKIYALISILAIISVIASFAATVKFLLEINNFIFSVDEKIVKDKTVLLDKERFFSIKDKLIAPETVFSPPIQISPTLSPSSTPAPTPALSTAPSPSGTPAVSIPF
jgi:hypothetical protein